MSSNPRRRRQRRALCRSTKHPRPGRRLRHRRPSAAALSQAADHLEFEIEHFTWGTTYYSERFAAAHQFLHSSEQLSMQADELKGFVGRFLNDVRAT